VACPRFLDHSAWRPKYLNHDHYGGGIIGRCWVVIAVGGTAELLPCEVAQLCWFDEAGAEARGPLTGSWNAAFERAAPTRAFGSFKGQRSFQGSWWLSTTGEHVGFESWLERDVLMALDFDADVVAVASQPFWLSWPGEGRPRRHAPDYFARRVDGSALVIDVRADDRIDAHDAEVFAATAQACEWVGWQYERRGKLDPLLGANLRMWWSCCMVSGQALRRGRRRRASTTRCGARCGSGKRPRSPSWRRPVRRRR
jgi:hypothetical protein